MCMPCFWDTTEGAGDPMDNILSWNQTGPLDSINPQICFVLGIKFSYFSEGNWKKKIFFLLWLQQIY